MADADADESAGASTQSVERVRPGKPLPTHRLTFDSQLSILRAYAAASGQERKAVTNADVGQIAEVNPDSVSLCNPFWQDIGLISREGRRQRPTDPVFDYFQAYQWNPDTATAKLRSTIEAAWFSSALLPRLRFRALSKAEATQVLAESSSTSKAFETNLGLVIEYMRAAGLIAADNGMLSIVNLPAPTNEVAKVVSSDSLPPDVVKAPRSGTRDFSIPIPGKASAIISVPDDIDAADWEMLGQMIQLYIRRWKMFPHEASKEDSQ